MKASARKAGWLGMLLCLTACATPTAAPVPASPDPTAAPGLMECTVLPQAGDASAMMAAFEDDLAHSTGPADAGVTVLVFTDFQCPGCAVLAGQLEIVMASHPDDVRLVVRYLPDARFDKSLLAMQAAEAAGMQGKFWEMYGLLFEKQPEWYGLEPEAFTTWLGEQAAGLGLDSQGLEPGQFLADLTSEPVQSRVALSSGAAEESTFLPPLLYINSTSPYNGMADAASLDQVVRLALLEGEKFHACPDWVLDPARQVLVTLETARGSAVLQLFPEKAPLAVNNFIFLARAGWYDDSPFHRMEAGFVIQGGDPSGTGYGNPGYYFRTEAAPGLMFNRAGLVAMSNTGVDTNGCQFFITYAPAHQLDGNFTIFGEVLTGMDVLEGLSAGDRLLGVSVEER